MFKDTRKKKKRGVFDVGLEGKVGLVVRKRDAWVQRKCSCNNNIYGRTDTFH